MPHLPALRESGAAEGTVRRKAGVREMTINHRKVDTQNPAYRPQNQFSFQNQPHSPLEIQVGGVGIAVAGGAQFTPF